MGITRRNVLAGAAAAAMAPAVWSQGASGKSIRLVIPYPPGGGTDILARHIAKGMEAALGVAVVPDNKAGGSGLIAAENVARSEADGNTLLVVENAITINPFIVKGFNIRPDKDLSAVSLMGTAPLIMVVNPNLPVKNVAEFVAYAKANPSKLTYGSAGNGNPTHIGPEMFKLASGTDILQIPYKGSGPAITDLVGGQISMMFTGISAVKGFVESGRLKALGVTGTSRSPAMPQVPTLAEAGFAVPDMDNGTWWGIMAPKGLPAAAAKRLADAIAKAGRDPEITAKLAAMAITPIHNTPDAFTRWVDKELVKHADLVKRAKIEAS